MLNFVLCDDNQSTLTRLTKMLETILLTHNLDGQVTYTTTSSSKALAFIKDNPVNVVILDIDLKDSTSRFRNS